VKKLVCGCFGNIYYATILKDGLMSDRGRIELTDDAINAVIDHLHFMELYEKEGYSGYDIPKKDGGEIRLRLYDAEKYELVRKKEE
jgi:hypothetical protein